MLRSKNRLSEHVDDSSAAPINRKRYLPKNPILTIELKLTSCIALFVCFLVGICWIFFLGVLLGRGYNPEEHMPILQSLTEQTEPVENELDILIAETIDNTENNTEIDGRALGKPSSTVVSNSQLSSSRPKAARPQAAKPQADKPQASKPPKPQAATSQQNNDSVSRTNEDRFDYSIQLAAFKQIDQANNLANKLKNDSLEKVSVSTSTNSNGVTWHRVYLKFKGTKKDLDKVKNKLKKHKINSPMVSEKRISR